MRLRTKLFYLGTCLVLALGGWTASAFVDAYYGDMAVKLVGWMGALFGAPPALLWLLEWIAPDHAATDTPVGRIIPDEPPQRRAG